MQQIGAAGAFAVEMVRRVVRSKIAVGGRIPERVVHAVQNAAQIGRALVENAVELLAELRRLYLLGVLAAHGGQQIGKNHAALEEVEAVVLLHLVHGEKLPWEQELLRGIGRKLTLVGGVMDGEHRGRAAEHGIGGVSRAQIHRNQRGLPVVDVEDVAARPAALLPPSRRGKTGRSARHCRHNRRHRRHKALSGQTVPDNR